MRKNEKKNRAAQSDTYENGCQIQNRVDQQLPNSGSSSLTLLLIVVGLRSKAKNPVMDNP